MELKKKKTFDFVLIFGGANLEFLGRILVSEDWGEKKGDSWQPKQIGIGEEKKRNFADGRE